VSSFCKHCGSRNHSAFDCSKQHLTYTPTAEDLALDTPAPEPVAAVEEPKEPEPTFEPRERFPGCPPICNLSNLPAHESYAAAMEFHERHGPSCKVLKVVQCLPASGEPWAGHCRKWHLHSVAPAPAGASSGSTREFYPLKKEPFRRKLRESSFAQFQNELPQQERKPQDAQPKKLASKPKGAPKSGPSLGELFERKKTK